MTNLLCLPKKKFTDLDLETQKHQHKNIVTNPPLLPLTHPHSSATRGVSHCGLAICIKKYLKAKEE
jgi:hypothetical protein